MQNKICIKNNMGDKKVYQKWIPSESFLPDHVLYTQIDNPPSNNF